MHSSQIHHVAAGSYHVGHTRAMVLQASLATCVGVILYDKTASVGGLIHLLLPEPISSAPDIQLEKYASTAMPIFLNALYDAGADQQGLKAAIAGGALVGPIVSRDLQLDIGGRTVETVLDFLRHENIPIEKAETGGFFTCQMSLDMHNWRWRIEPIGMNKPAVTTEVQAPAADDIDRCVERIQPIPQVALKILRLINEEQYEIGKLAEQIRSDQVISAKTLKLCNSSLFSRRLKIESLDHALSFLGMETLVKLVIASAMENFFDISIPGGYSLCKGGLYHHAIGTAIIAEKLAAKTGRAKPATAYTAGLLHDIGKVVLDQYVAAAYPLFYREMADQAIDLCQAEKTIFGLDHTQVGSRLARQWSFPASLTDAIRHHHAPENAAENVGLVHIVYLADLLMSRFHSGLELDRMDTTALLSILETVGLSIDQFPDMVDLIPTGVLGLPPEDNE